MQLRSRLAPPRTHPPKRGRSPEHLTRGTASQPAPKRQCVIRPTHPPQAAAARAAQPTKAAPQRAPLTAQNLQLHIGGAPAKEMRSKRDRTGAPTTSASSRTTTTDPAFGEKLTANGVIHEGWRAQQPDDYDAIRETLERRRASSSPDSKAWRKYSRIVGRATNEDTIQGVAFSRLVKPQDDGDEEIYEQVLNQEWTEVEECNITRGLSNPKPDYIESFGTEDYPEEAKYDLGGHLQPSVYHHGMPRLAIELKQPMKGLRQAEWQAAYDGAVMVDAVRTQDEYRQQSFAYSQTQALTIASTGDRIAIYANHAVPISKGTEYHHFQLFDIGLCATREAYSSARRRVRNAQDWARSKASASRDGLRQYIDGRAQITPPVTRTSGEPPSKGKQKKRRDGGPPQRPSQRW